jgi:hypothetical protein
MLNEAPACPARGFSFPGLCGFSRSSGFLRGDPFDSGSLADAPAPTNFERPGAFATARHVVEKSPTDAVSGAKIVYGLGFHFSLLSLVQKIPAAAESPQKQGFDSAIMRPES